MIDLIKLKNKLKLKFDENNIDTNEVNIMLCECLKIDYSKLIVKKNINFFQYLYIIKVANLRLKGKPLTKIFKRAYFYGLKIKINNYVLSPRQETEILVDNASKYITKNNDVLDLCTGSGIIALAVKNNVINCNVDASDISAKALKMAKRNAKNLKLQINFIQSDLFDKISKKYDFILSNPPYIRSLEINNLQTEVKRYDPILALDGGQNGLEFYEKIIRECKQYLKPNGKIIFEIGFDQARDVASLLKKSNFSYEIIKDYENRDRVVIASVNY